MKNRDIDLKLYQHRYLLLRDKANPFDCIYCGVPAAQLDHCPPISKAKYYEDLCLEKELYLKVPACSECNLLLSDSFQEDFEGRIEYLKDCLAKKYSKMFIGGAWTDERLLESELNGQLRAHIIKHGRKQSVLLQRLNFYNGLKIYRDFLLEHF